MAIKMSNRGSALILFLCLLAAHGCDYARMNDQESVRTYKKEAPPMDGRTIPVQDGFQALKHSDPTKLANPLPPGDASVRQGKEAYGYFCVHCHGERADGNGAVGQVFLPSPPTSHPEACRRKATESSTRRSGSASRDIRPSTRPYRRTTHGPWCAT